MVRNKISQTANARETIQSGEHRHSAWTEGSRNIPTPSHIPHRAQVATLCCILRHNSAHIFAEHLLLFMHRLPHHLTLHSFLLLLSFRLCLLLSHLHFLERKQPLVLLPLTVPVFHFLNQQLLCSLAPLIAESSLLSCLNLLLPLLHGQLAVATVHNILPLLLRPLLVLNFPVLLLCSNLIHLPFQAFLVLVTKSSQILCLLFNHLLTSVHVLAELLLSTSPPFQHL
mmetsp:Transcript_6052/g.11258  ORF Transcript_6052/g.11258 Transcript_6052/m.11258 type:complete len:227 (-) Transcript_6052:863-1543(-)